MASRCASTFVRAYSGQPNALTKCDRLANLVLPPPGIKYKSSSMPFVQRENISHFLRACEMPPLNMHAHDRFLTVDLYDNKDPAQVIQCIGAFSRAANAVNRSRFPDVIGPKKATPATPARGHATSASIESLGGYGRSRGFSGASQASDNRTARALSPALTGGSNSSRATDAGSRQPAVSSWSKRGDETATAPAWNIHQYGYMGGASQGNQGISFGARRQITSPSVQVPNLAEKEKRRKEQEAEVERTRREQEDSRRQQDDRDRVDEEQRWEEESRRARQKQKDDLDAQRRQWEEEERTWKEEEEKRRREEEQAAAALPTTPGGVGLRGQRLSEHKSSPGSPDTPENSRIQELERQLEEARERERQYQIERAQRKRPIPPPKPTDGPTPREPQPVRPSGIVAAQAPTNEAPTEDERDSLKQEWNKQQAEPSTAEALPTAPITRPPPPAGSAQLVDASPTPLRPGSPEHTPSEIERDSPTILTSNGLTSTPSTSIPQANSTNAQPRPLPDDRPYVAYSRQNPASPPQQTATTPHGSRFLTSNPSPVFKRPTSTFANEVSMSSTAEQAGEDRRRVDSQQATKAGGWASKSLMEREMERERQRQKEWEEAQMTREGGPRGPRAMR